MASVAGWSGRRTTDVACSAPGSTEARLGPVGPVVLDSGDHAIVVAQSLGTLAPLKLHDLHTAPRTAAVVPSA